jgi:hypothetical protein
MILLNLVDVCKWTIIFGGCVNMVTADGKGEGHFFTSECI